MGKQRGALPAGPAHSGGRCPCSVSAREGRGAATPSPPSAPASCRPPCSPRGEGSRRAPGARRAALPAASCPGKGEGGSGAPGRVSSPATPLAQLPLPSLPGPFLSPATGKGDRNTRASRACSSFTFREASDQVYFWLRVATRSVKTRRGCPKDGVGARVPTPAQPRRARGHLNIKSPRPRLGLGRLSVRSPPRSSFLFGNLDFLASGGESTRPCV